MLIFPQEEKSMFLEATVRMSLKHRCFLYLSLCNISVYCNCLTLLYVCRQFELVNVASCEVHCDSLIICHSQTTLSNSDQTIELAYVKPRECVRILPVIHELFWI